MLLKVDVSEYLNQWETLEFFKFCQTLLILSLEFFMQMDVTFSPRFQTGVHNKLPDISTNATQ